MQPARGSEGLSDTIGLPAPEAVLVRYGELSLKGGNRGDFERALMRNVRTATKSICDVRVERLHGRLIAYPERRTEAVARRLQDVFGIKSVSPTWEVETRQELILPLAKAIFEDALGDFDTRTAPPSFRVRTKRADKRFPIKSSDFDRLLADHLLADHDEIRVRLKHPELELGVELREERSFVFVKRLPALGGLPVGTLGRVLCLLSGGIDSPVAAWMAMKRGCNVGFVSYHSHPFIGEPSKKKVIDLARRLMHYQPKGQLYVVPFTEVQTTIRDSAPEGYRTILYRRMMQRIATRLAASFHYDALVTGESLGQVASQTLENVRCIAAATELEVLRPLIAFDKEETIQIARRIETLEISNLPEPDCCTVFMPRRPVIRGKLEDCLAAEAQMDVEGLIERAVDGVEVHTLQDG